MECSPSKGADTAWSQELLNPKAQCGDVAKASDPLCPRGRGYLSPQQQPPCSSARTLSCESDASLPFLVGLCAGEWASPCLPPPQRLPFCSSSVEPCTVASLADAIFQSFIVVGHFPCVAINQSSSSSALTHVNSKPTPTQRLRNVARTAMARMARIRARSCAE